MLGRGIGEGGAAVDRARARLRARAAVRLLHGGGHRCDLPPLRRPTPPLSTDRGGRVPQLGRLGRHRNAPHGARRRDLAPEHLLPTTAASRSSTAAGQLYIGVGDGGSGGRPRPQRPEPGDSLGKILGSTPGRRAERPTVPGDHPPFDRAGRLEHLRRRRVRQRRFSLDRQRRATCVGDVGQNRLEEIDSSPGPRVPAQLRLGQPVPRRARYPRRGLGLRVRLPVPLQLRPPSGAAR